MLYKVALFILWLAAIYQESIEGKGRKASTNARMYAISNNISQTGISFLKMVHANPLILSAIKVVAPIKYLKTMKLYDGYGGENASGVACEAEILGGKVEIFQRAW